MNEQNIYDVVIIGAGPAGLTAAIFARNKGFRVAILEGQEAGGQLKSLYPFKPVYNYPGYSRIQAGELAGMMLQQVRQNDIPVIENDPVETINSLSQGLFQVNTRRQVLQTRAVILACGMGLFQPRRLNVPGEQELENKKIFFSITNPEEWREQEVAILGGGNSAVDHALFLLEKNARITLIHRLSKFNAEPASVEKLRQEKVEILLNWQVLRFEENQGGKVAIHIQENTTNEERVLLKDRVLVNIGLQPNLDFLKHLPVEKKGRQVVVDSEMRTSLPGVFACGDVVTYPGKVRLIATAIGEAATAVNSLERYLKILSKSNAKVSHES